MSPRARGNALPHGYRLHWYRIESLLGQGGFGITYLAHDTNLDKPVAIKEYLPVELAVRETDSTVRPFTEDRRDQYTWGLKRFIEEARTLANFSHPNIVQVHTVFEDNATAYMVMTYEVGETLEEIAKFNTIKNEAELLAVIHPLIDALEHMHAAGFIHRDIKPENIVVRPSGDPVLLDFGSARLALGGETRTLTSVVSAGFAPYEQYHSEPGNQGPWTDLYGFGATLYAIINRGRGPLDAIVRGKARIEGTPDPMEPAITIGSGRYSRQLLEAIDAALAFAPDERPQTMAEFRAIISHEGNGDSAPEPDDVPTDVHNVAAPVITGFTTESTPTPHLDPDTQEHKSQPRLRANWAAILVLLIGISGFIWWYQEQIRVAFLDGGTTQVQESDNKQQLEIEANTNRKTRIAELLERAKKALDGGHLIEPTQDNARDFYRAVAKLDPGNSNSIMGLRFLVDQLTEKAELALKKNQFEDAESFLDEADNTISSTSQVRTIREQLTQRKNQLAEERKDGQSKRERIASLLSGADADRKALRLTSPEGANAVEKYREVLAIDKRNTEAQAGLVAVIDRYVTLANDAITSKNFDKASVYLEHAAGVMPGAENVQNSREVLRSAQIKFNQQTKRETTEASRLAAEVESKTTIERQETAALVPPTQTPHLIGKSPKLIEKFKKIDTWINNYKVDHNLKHVRLLRTDLKTPFLNYINDNELQYLHKALAFGADNTGWPVAAWESGSSVETAINKSLDSCHSSSGIYCKLFAIGNILVWDMSKSQIVDVVFWFNTK